MSRFLSEAPRPMVLLLGWLGSKEQYLSKYTRLYQDLGAQVIPHQPTMLQTALPAVADKALLRFMRDFNKSYSLLCSLRGETPPVLVHAMSNAGFIAYGTMLHLVSLLHAQGPLPSGPFTPSEGGVGGGLEFNPAAWRALGGGPRLTAASAPAMEPPSARSFGLWGEGGRWSTVCSGAKSVTGGETRVHPFLRDPAALAVLSAFRQVVKNTQGIVLDSAPSQANVHIWSRGMLSAMLSEPAISVEESHPVMLAAARRLADRYLAAPQVAKRLREVRHAWQYAVPACPQLYLYSKADALVPYQHIERFMDQQAAHGVSVQHHCWDDAPHCELLRKHPEQYKSIVRSFVEHSCHFHTPPENWI